MVGRLGIGNGIGIPFRNKVNGGGGNSLPPELKEALCGVWIADQNTNESPTRNIIKNKISGRGGDFEILNAAYKGNSGYGKYEEDFTSWIKGNNIEVANNYIKVTGAASGYLLTKITPNSNISSFAIKITGIPQNGEIRYYYCPSSEVIGSFYIREDGEHIIPQSVKYELEGAYRIGFTISNPNLDWSNLVIEQVPDYQGAFVTDGVDDMIVSQKSVSEMLGGSNELTVVSMMHQIAFRTNSNNSLTNQIRPTGDTFIRNSVTAFNKTGIYGYTISNLNNSLYNNTVVNNILGDKNDYVNSFSSESATDGLFSVEGYKRNDGYFTEVSKVAWYWTFIAKRVLTTDEINQVIAYYNLDKYVAPDIYYDVKKQGLTNDNHTEFGDKLIDYSGNGKDMQLYNFGWKLDSGVGKYEVDFTTFTTYNGTTRTNNRIYIPKDTRGNILLLSYTNMTSDINSFIVKVTGFIGGWLTYYYRNEDGKEQQFRIIKDGTYTIPKGYKTETGTGSSMGFVISSNGIVADDGLTITQLPSYENALVFDGVDDCGQYVGDLGLKDYTVVADRAYVELIDRQVPIISNITSSTTTPFIYEFSSPLPNAKSFSFNSSSTNSNIPIDISRKVSYQSTYVYNGNAVTKGTITNTGDGLTFGRYGGNTQYAALCLYNFMLFPYSLSEFLIERQLKKKKLGTLHPEINKK